MTLVLAALREKLAAQKLEKVLHSSDTSQPTITLLVTLFNKGYPHTYINYMRGMDNLVNWLTNNRSIPIDYELARYPKQLDTSWSLPVTLYSYNIQELTKILVPDWMFPSLESTLSERAKVSRAIVLASLPNSFN